MMGNAHYIADNRFYNIKTRYQKGPCVKLRFTQGFQRWDYLNMDYTWSWTGAYLQSWVAFEYDKFAGLQMNECFHTGQLAVLGAAAVYNTSCGGFKILGATLPFNAFFWGRLVRSESSVGFGIQITDMNFVNLLQSGTFGTYGLGVLLTNCNFVNIVDLSARGVNDTPGITVVPSAHGVSLVSCLNVTLNGLNLNKNTGSGLFMSNTSNAMVSSIQSSDNVRYGIEETGTSNGNSYAPARLSGNTLGATSSLGAASRYVPLPVGLAYANTWAETQTFAKPSQDPEYTVATLPAATQPRQRCFVNDATVAYAGASVGTVVVGGGANRVPVYSTGAVWVIG